MNIHVISLRAGLTLFVAIGLGCGDADAVYGEPGEPLSGLSDTQLTEFHGGAALFNKVFLPEEGLGPLFNENQCSACHTSPAPGGTTGFERVVRASRFENGVCDPLSHLGGENVRTQATPQLRALGIEREIIPDVATEVGRFTTPFLFGLGLVEAIPNETILALADPEDVNGDGISGKAGRTADGRLARFGRKAEVASIREFIDTALRFEMGLSTALTPNEELINGSTPFPENTDLAPEPEIDERGLDFLTAFVRFLAPPAPREARSQEHADTLDAGRRLFEQIGCIACHKPSLRTGPNEIDALDQKTVRLYSDLLLHDMGPELTDVCGAGASPSELRTEMLMGLGHRSLYLHDGRADTLEEAILAHGGEAQAARDGFRELSWLRQQFLYAFLRGL